MDEKIGMEFLGLFGGKKKEEAPKEQLPELTQDVVDDIFMTARMLMNQNKKKKCSFMKFSKGKVGLTDSKVGGVPFMTSNSRIPMCDNGAKQMLMLCQVNCADVPKGLGFPIDGIYQIWIDPEEAFNGYYDDSEYFKMIYFDVMDEEKNGLSEEECREKYNPKNYKIFKINGEFKITFGAATVDTPSLYDPTVYEKFINAISKKYIKKDPGYGIEDAIDVVYEAFEVENSSIFYDAEDEFEEKYLVPSAKKARIGGYIPCSYKPNPDDNMFPEYESHANDLNLVLCYFDLKNKELFTISNENETETVHYGFSAKSFEEAKKHMYCPSQVVW